MRKKDRSKRQTTIAHAVQFSISCQANGAVEWYTEGGVKRKREGKAAGFIKEDTHKREAQEMLLRQTPEK